MEIARSVEFLKQSREAIFSQWEAVTRERVSAAEGTESIALRDHLPIVYGDILEVTDDLARNGGTGRAAAKKIAENSAPYVHGRHRASTQGYTVQSIIHEYYILEEVITKFLDQAGLWNRQVVEAIHYLVQAAVKITAETFTTAIEEMQQKMLGTLVHDIRTPLSSSIVAINLREEQPADSEHHPQLDHLVKSGVERALDMLSGLLDNVIAEAGDGLMMDFTESDLAIEFNQAIKEAEIVYGSQVTVEEAPPPIPAVFDPAAFRRIMENLISNAVRYGQRGTPVTVSLNNQQNYVVLKVHNLGNPIAKERQKQIFEFFSPKDKGAHQPENSWGIGLAFIRLAVDGHQGSLDLASDETSGTTFAVTLPKHANKVGRLRTRLLKNL